MLATPCITLRENTEWVETVQAGWNILVGADYAQIIKNIAYFQSNSAKVDIFGDGNAAERICDILHMQ